MVATFSRVEPFSTRILIKLKPEANGTQVADQIRSLDPTQIYGADSFDEQWRQSQQMNNQITYGSLQTLDIQGLGLVFAVLSASVGTALIAIVSLKERSREATLMSVRGLSYRQLVWMFLTESMAIITFAVILGISRRSHHSLRIGNLHKLDYRFLLTCYYAPNLSPRRFSDNWHIHRSDLRFHNRSDPRND